MDDTSPEMAEKVREMFRMKAPVERLKMGCSMYETSKTLVIRAILRESPHISEVELKKEVFLRFYRDDFSAAEREKIFAHLEKCGGTASDGLS